MVASDFACSSWVSSAPLLFLAELGWHLRLWKHLSDTLPDHQNLMMGTGAWRDRRERAGCFDYVPARAGLLHILGLYSLLFSFQLCWAMIYKSYMTYDPEVWFMHHCEMITTVKQLTQPSLAHRLLLQWGHSSSVFSKLQVLPSVLAVVTDGAAVLPQNQNLIPFQKCHPISPAFLSLVATNITP